MFEKFEANQSPLEGGEDISSKDQIVAEAQPFGDQGNSPELHQVEFNEPVAPEAVANQAPLTQEDMIPHEGVSEISNEERRFSSTGQESQSVPSSGSVEGILAEEERLRVAAEQTSAPESVASEGVEVMGRERDTSDRVVDNTQPTGSVMEREPDRTDRVVDNTASANMVRENESGLPDRVTDNTEVYREKLEAFKKKDQEVNFNTDFQVETEREVVETTGGYAEPKVSEEGLDLGDGVQIVGEGFVPETPQGVDSREVFAGNDVETQAITPEQELDGGMQVMAGGVQFEGNTPGSPESMTFSREQVEAMVAHKLDLFNGTASENAESTMRFNREFIKHVARHPELSHLILTASPEMLSVMRYPSEAQPGTFWERYKQSRQEGRGILKKIMEIPGKTTKAIVGMFRSTWEGIKSLAFAPIEKATGFLNQLVAGRNDKRQKHFEKAEAQKGELSPAQQEKLARAKSKTNTARTLSDLISNRI